MENKKEMTTPNVSVGADMEQSIQKCTDNSIADCDENIKSFEEMQREMLRQLSPSYLKTVSMSALYDTVFDIQTPLIDGLLQRGTYLFVGSPKVGKSFMMAQLAYHISTGISLWDYKVRKATVLYMKGRNRQWQRQFLRKWAALMYGKGIILSPVLPHLPKKNRSLSAYGDNCTNAI